MKERFDKDDRIGKAIFSLLPKHALEMESDLDVLKHQLLFWEEDIDSPTTLLQELKEWVAHWKLQPSGSAGFPANIIECLAHADEDQFPNIRKSLLIGCTLPVGSAKASGGH